MNAKKNVIFSSTGEQAVDLDAEYARAAATEQTFTPPLSEAVGDVSAASLVNRKALSRFATSR